MIKFVNMVNFLFLVMGLIAIIGMFYIDWKMALCIFALVWSDRFLRGR